MTHAELAHLELLAEVDTLLGRLEAWAGDAPNWRIAETCRALVQRLAQRTNALRVRLESPLVVATLGGTGTGKSSLVNALVGEEVSPTGRQRPTTTRPRLVCRPDLTPEMLGIDPQAVEVVHRELPSLAELVLLDCPDPDTTEQEGAPGTNLARLRGLLPHCDVLLVTTTQQKYRSARVADELASAASGARLVFVQTHADLDEDIRDDWRRVLSEDYSAGRIFRVDSPAALADARAGIRPRGEFGELVDLLTRELAGAAGNRIRRANFLDLVAEVLAACRRRIDAALPEIDSLQQAIETQRAKLAAGLAQQMQGELLSSSREWENRLINRAASRWGFSPFALLLRAFQGIGGLIAGRTLWRMRTPTQMALWGAVQGARALRSRRRKKRAEKSITGVAGHCWDETELRSATLILDGYAQDAGIDRQAATPETVAAEADDAAGAFVAKVAGEVEAVIDRLARRHTGWFTRLRYEVLLLAMVGFILYRLAKNFFYDSWFAPADAQVAVYGIEFYLAAGFWLLLWCLLLLILFTTRLRRGLRREIAQMGSRWNASASASGVFASLDDECRQARRFRDRLGQLEAHVADLRRRLALPDDRLGHRVSA